MKITKLGHCCLLIEDNGVKILTDPGSFSSAQDNLTDIDLLLITHEHQDHFHIDSVKAILKNNPNIAIITNSAVGKLLDAEGIKYQQVEDGQSADFKGVAISGHGTEHAEIYKEVAMVLNTGYFIDNRLFYPGDAFYNPGKKVEILALPVAGPFARFREVVDYAKEIAPRVCFPVHDAVLSHPEFFAQWQQQILKNEGVEMVIPKIGEEIKEIQ